MFEIEEVKGQNAKIKVVGIGGAGGNAINHWRHNTRLPKPLDTRPKN